MIKYKSIQRIVVVAAVLLTIFIFVPPPVSATGAGGMELSFAVLPILDAIPFHYADEKGFFKELGLTVKQVPVGSALERDQLMQAERIDGMIGENAVVASFNRETTKLQVVSIARESVEGFPLFRVLSSPKSGITETAMLSDVPIAVSKNTIIEYVTDRLLSKKGLAFDKIVKKSVPVIPERFQLLISGRIPAATIPDPLAVSAVKSGAIEVINDTAFPEYSASVVIFSKKTIDEKKDAVIAFMKAWDKAAQRINEDPKSASGIVSKKIRVPKNVSPDFIIPPFPRGKVPSKWQWDDMMAWMVEKALLDKPVSYETSVTSAYLPK